MVTNYREKEDSMVQLFDAVKQVNIIKE